MGLPTLTVPHYTLKLPSSEEELRYRPFLIKEEKILLIALESEDEKEVINAIKEIITNCVYGDINVDEMATFDLEYIFLQLRAKSKGEIIDLKYECPKCKTAIEVKVDINDIQITTFPEHDKKIELSEEIGVMMKYPTLDKQNDVLDRTKEGKQVEGIFDLVSSSIDFIYDKENTYPLKDHTKEEIDQFMESLTDPQFQKMTDFFNSMPVLKHEIKMKCPGPKPTKKGQKKKTCDYVEEQTLSGLQSFFV